MVEKICYNHKQEACCGTSSNRFSWVTILSVAIPRIRQRGIALYMGVIKYSGILK